jgi:hypothetical protein
MLLDRPDAFDPEINALLSAAFEAAWDEYRGQAARPTDEQDRLDTRDLIARRIVQMGNLGERDQSILVADALAHVARVKGASHVER